MVLRGLMFSSGAKVLCVAILAVESAAGQPAGYVDAGACASCHRAIADSYARTGMARSFAAVPQAVSIPPIAGGVFRHEPSQEFFALSAPDGKAALERYQTGFDGRVSNTLDATLDYRFGSGNHAVSYLHRTAAGELVELPLSWYPEKGGNWAMSPGFDRPDHNGFGRKVTYRCLFCHDAYPAIAAGTDSDEAGTRFPVSLPEGIDCQRCHGPGRQHVEAAQRGAAPEAIRSAIVNPARMAPARRMDVCLQCHLETTSLELPGELMRSGRSVFSYRPGEPLEDYQLYFDHAPGAGYDDKFELVSAPYRLAQSACFRASAGALTCTTCHNPHDIPRGQAAVEHYREVCRSCHQTAIAQLIAAGKHPAADDCVGCHMPKRRPVDAIHITITDHYIRRRPQSDAGSAQVERHDGNTPPYRGEVAPYGPKDELYLAVAQVKNDANLAVGVPRLEAALAKTSPTRGEPYAALGDAYRDTGRLDAAATAYEKACALTPTWRHFFSLGMVLFSTGQWSQSLAALERARSLAPGEAAIAGGLAALYSRQGKLPEALSALQAAQALDPGSVDTLNNLGAISLRMDRASDAEKYWRETIRLRPEIAPPHLNLADLLAGRGDFAEATYQFEAALRIDASSAEGHAAYAAALVSMGRLPAAREQYQEALRLKPALPEARANLGTLLLQLGDAAGAIREYRLALAGRPDDATTYYDLALALEKLGNLSGAEGSLRSAIERAPDLFEAHLTLGRLLVARHRADLAAPYLRKAAESADPRIRKAAQELLK
jgi:predicted CXXCH cytochrome family protein